MKIKTICLGCAASLVLSVGTILAKDNNVFARGEEMKDTSTNITVNTENVEKRSSASELEDNISEEPAAEEEELPKAVEEEASEPDLQSQTEVETEPETAVPGTVTEEDVWDDENWTDFY